jgi:hypothetical protein
LPFQKRRKEKRRTRVMAGKIPEELGKYRPVTTPVMRANSRGIRGLE